MIVVTQPKVDGFWPRWSPFKGFSLLFDSPGQSTSPFEDGLVKLDCQVHTAPEQDFYGRLVTGLDKIGLDMLINTYLFCPLEPYSYHTTVWDGLNDGNAARVIGEQKRPLRRYFDHFPHSFTTDTVFTEGIAQSPLVTDTWNITFQCDSIVKWGNVGLAAALKTADPASTIRYEQLKQARNELYDLFESRFDLALKSDFAPHVSLGYFANKEQAELASPQMARWQDIMQQELDDATITYHNVSLYGFTDMITFFKRS